MQISLCPCFFHILFAIFGGSCRLSTLRFYLAQAYGALQKPSLSARFCAETMSRQLEVPRKGSCIWSRSNFEWWWNKRLGGKANSKSKNNRRSLFCLLKTYQPHSTIMQKDYRWQFLMLQPSTIDLLQPAISHCPTGPPRGSCAVQYSWAAQPRNSWTRSLWSQRMDQAPCGGVWCVAAHNLETQIWTAIVGDIKLDTCSIIFVCPCLARSF